MEIFWEKVLNLRISKKLSEVCNQWGFNLRYLDPSYREIRSINRQEETLCRWVEHHPPAKTLCDAWVKALAQETQRRKQTSVDTCPAGLVTILVPMIIQDECLGYLVAEGVQSHSDGQKTEEYKNRLSNCGVNLVEYDRLRQETPVLTREKVDVFKGLLETMVEEMVAYQKELGPQPQKGPFNLSASDFDFSSIVGKSQPLLRIFETLEKIIPSDSTVLLLGESGTGKEMISRIVHYNSPRKDKAFIAENCSAFSENLLESELFGHEKGAFTGAVVQKKGLFELADGGTFLLDEVADTSPALQTKLLRVLQDGTFKRVGGVKFIKVDVRIVAATNKDLKKMVDNGTFREDLYYRLNEIKITLPPLRERGEDIPLLANYFLSKFCNERGIPLKQFSEEAVEHLVNYNWPGNIRELQNEVKRATLLSGSDIIITKKLLSTNILEEVEKKNLTKKPKPTGSLKSILEAVERDVIREGLERTNFNKSKLSRELGISRKNLILKVLRYELEKPGKRGRS
jgi:transcriptional regulator with PAS, ATPase and Fis domain